MTSPSLEERWVRLLDSRRWRRLRAAPPARWLFGGELFRSADMRRRRLVSRLAARRQPDRFDALGTMFLFIGHVKSGGTLVGAMIDAHPDALVGDEVDVLAHLDAGFSRAELLAVIARSSRREAMKGRVTARRLEPYSLAMPGQWQGHGRTVQAIGDSRAGPTTRRLGDDPGRLAELFEVAAPADLRFVHVVRNPLDPIGAMVRRGGRSVEDATQDYRRQAGRAARIRSLLDADKVHTLHYEDVVAEPSTTVGGVVEFLGLAQDAGHLQACRSLVDPSRVRERVLTTWTETQLAAVSDLVGEHDFLLRYAGHIDAGTWGRTG